MVRIAPLRLVCGAAALVAAAFAVLPSAAAGADPVLPPCTGCPQPTTTVPPPIAAAPGGPQRITAVLGPAQVRPRPKRPPLGVSGRFTAVIEDRRVTWALATANVSRGATVRIEMGPAGTNGPTVVALCANCAGTAVGIQTISRMQEDALRTGRVYVEVSTKLNPNGEIRGQIR
jgi:hypothetical protein